MITVMLIMITTMITMISTSAAAPKTSQALWDDYMADTASRYVVGRGDGRLIVLAGAPAGEHTRSSKEGFCSAPASPAHWSFSGMVERLHLVPNETAR